jgi:hypothetical protein
MATLYHKFLNQTEIRKLNESLVVIQRTFDEKESVHYRVENVKNLISSAQRREKRFQEEYR